MYINFTIASVHEALFTMYHTHHFPDKWAGHKEQNLSLHISKQTLMKVTNSGATITS